MEGQGNWYSGEQWIKERSDELLLAAHEAIRDQELKRQAREAVRRRQHFKQLDRDFVRLLGGFEHSAAPEPSTGLLQRFGRWATRLVGGQA